MALIQILILLIAISALLFITEASPFELEKRSVYGAFRHVPGYMLDAAVRNRKRMMGFETSDY